MRSDEWYTPKHIIEAVEREWGPIDTDPCWNVGSHVRPRLEYFCLDHFRVANRDGRAQRWQGFAWVNPPYSDLFAWATCHHLRWWLQKEDQQMTDNPRSLWLVPASPDTAWWQALTQKASWISFPRGRIRFEGPGPKGSPRFASAYVGFGLHVPRDPIFGRAWSPL